ncbi:MAG: hypothetical protein KIT09_12345 [Bryobacteraceae bacterium]|nr:hypothetical protein [Bryobacteraceae bacterium]
MATFAAIMERITGTKEEAEEQVRENAESEYLSRPLPNEQVYLWVRTIDNSRVRAVAPPGASRACWKSIVASLAVVALLVGVLLPLAYNLLAGYRLSALEVEHQRLLDDKARLEQEESALLSPAIMAEVAASRQLVDAAPYDRAPLAPAGDRALAMNR